MVKLQPRFYVIVTVIVASIVAFSFKDSIISLINKKESGQPVQTWTHVEQNTSTQKTSDEVSASKVTPEPTEVIEPIVPEKKKVVEHKQEVHKTEAAKKEQSNSRPVKKEQPKIEHKEVKETPVVHKSAPVNNEDDEKPAIYGR